MNHSKATLLLAFFAALFFIENASAQMSGQVVNFSLNRYNSATNGDKLPVVDGETIATMSMRAWTPADEYQSSTTFRTLVTGDPTPGWLPARLDIHNAPNNLYDMRRMTFLNTGEVGVGFPQDYDPITLFDVNGDARIRGLRIYLEDPNAIGGGEVLTRIDTDCFGAALPNGNGLAINFGGGFTDGVFIDGPGLEVCGEMDSDCLTADNNISSRLGNIYALGGAAIPDPCTLPAEGDFIAYGPFSDFISRSGNFVADEGDFTATQGNMTAFSNITAETGHIRAEAGFVSAETDVISENGNVVASTGNVTANINVTAVSGNVSAAVGNVTAGQDVSGGRDVIAGRDLIANDDLFVTDNLGIGLSDDALAAGWPDGYRLAVEGNIICEEVRVALQGDWPDYVFGKNYDLPTTGEIEKFIEENHHLPGIPSAAQVAEEGIAVGDMQARLLEKIEELTLLVIDQQKQIDELKKEQGNH